MPVSDVVLDVVRIAFERYERGEITHDRLVELLQKCVNLRAAQNGYAERYGMPFPRR